MNDQAFTIMNSIKGTPAYWKKFKSEVLLTLLCANLRWDKLIEYIQKLNKVDNADIDMSNLTYNEKCTVLNTNPFIVARYFQYKVEVSSELIGIDRSLGKSKNYTLRVEV